MTSVSLAFSSVFPNKCRSKLLGNVNVYGFEGGASSIGAAGSVTAKSTCLTRDVFESVSLSFPALTPGNNLLAASETTVPPFRPSKRVIKLKARLGPPALSHGTQTLYE